jgi:hypothetical protein
MGMCQKTGVLLLVVLLVGCFFVQDVFAIDVYTFKKDRVDQDVSGNRGYISGRPPAKPDRGTPKRTLIGVDVELPAIGVDSGEEMASSSEKKYTVPSSPTTVVGTPKPETVMRETFREEDLMKEGAAARRKKTVVKETEEDWIK